MVLRARNRGDGSLVSKSRYRSRAARGHSPADRGLHARAGRTRRAFVHPALEPGEIVEQGFDHIVAHRWGQSRIDSDEKGVVGNTVRFRQLPLGAMRAW